MREGRNTAPGYRVCQHTVSGDQLALEKIDFFGVTDGSGASSPAVSEAASVFSAPEVSPSLEASAWVSTAGSSSGATRSSGAELIERGTGLMDVGLLLMAAARVLMFRVAVGPLGARPELNSMSTDWLSAMLICERTYASMASLISSWFRVIWMGCS